MIRRRRALPIVVFALAAVQALPAVAKKHPIPAAVDAILAPLPGTYAYVIRDLDTGEEWARNPDTPFPLASAAKAFVAMATLADVEDGNLLLTDRLKVSSDLMSPPSGILQDFDAGLEPTVSDLLHLMVSVSDNTAADVLTRKIAIERIRARMTDAELLRSDFFITNRALFLLSMGLGRALPGKGPERAAAWGALTPSQRIAVVRAVEDEHKGMPYDELEDRLSAYYAAAEDPWRDPRHIAFVAAIDNKSTARDMADFYTRMARGTLLSEGLSEKLLELLTEHERFGFEDDLALDPSVSYAHKGGSDGGIRAECGVLLTQDGRAIVVVLLGQGFREEPDTAKVQPVDDAFLRIHKILTARLATKK
ncbi:MAG: serine hydrolase [Acidobacteriota bacterium]